MHHTHLQTAFWQIYNGVAIGTAYPLMQLYVQHASNLAKSHPSMTSLLLDLCRGNSLSFHQLLTQH
jgi:hypothetical protein